MLLKSFVPWPIILLGMKHLTASGLLEGGAVAWPTPHFFARQAIFTKDQKVFGYELLFRGGI